MRRPWLLDLFCGAGGAAVGYARAGFDVVGVDIRPQPNYPFEFIEDDALEFLRYGDWATDDLDAIHASPPCQRYSTATKRNGTQDNHPDLIAETRELLIATGLPYVIENVVGAPLVNPLTVCGSWFRLELDDTFRLRRHRLFECSWITEPAGRYFCRCHLTPKYQSILDVTGGGPTKKERTDGGGGRPYKGTADQARRIMGIDWMTKAELNEAIPPAYTELIGGQLLAQIRPLAASSSRSDPGQT